MKLQYILTSVYAEKGKEKYYDDLKFSLEENPHHDKGMVRELCIEFWKDRKEQDTFFFLSEEELDDLIWFLGESKRKIVEFNNTPKLAVINMPIDED